MRYTYSIYDYMIWISCFTRFANSQHIELWASLLQNTHTHTITLLAQRTNHCGKYRLNIPTNLSFIFISLRFCFSIWHTIRYRNSFCLEYCLTYLNPNKAAKSTRMNEIKRRKKKSQTNNLYAYGDDRKNEHANGNEML